jgi:hypothetical protein
MDGKSKVAMLSTWDQIADHVPLERSQSLELERKLSTLQSASNAG